MTANPFQESLVTEAMNLEPVKTIGIAHDKFSLPCPSCGKWVKNGACVECLGAKSEVPSILSDPNLWKITDANLAVKIRKDPIGRQTVFLTELTAFQPRPSHGLLSGGSSIGKTHLALKPTELLPEGNVIIIGSSTQRAWFYGGTPIYEKGLNGKQHIHHYEIDWTNKIVIILDNVDETTIKDLKPVMSHDNFGKPIEIQATMKGQGGNYRTVKVRITGCPCFINCTTRLRWNEELSTRHFFVTPLDSHDKYAEALEYIGKREINGAEPELPDGDRIRTAIQWLIDQKIKVVISEEVERKVRAMFPANAPREMRDFERVLTMVKTHAWLFAVQREKNEQGAVIATVQDFNEIEHLIKPVIRMSKYSTNEQVIDFYEKVLLPAVTGDTRQFSLKEASKLYHDHYKRTIGPVLLRSYFETLETLDFVETELQGRKNVYTVTKDKETVQEIPELGTSGTSPSVPNIPKLIYENPMKDTIFENLKQ